MDMKFDCVKMKNDIQRQLLKEYEGLSLEERKIIMEKEISSDPILGPWLNKVGRKPLKQAMVAEGDGGDGYAAVVCKKRGERLK